MWNSYFDSERSYGLLGALGGALQSTGEDLQRVVARWCYKALARQI